MASFDRFVQTSWAYAVLALVVFATALPGVVSMPVLDRDEARFAQASAQMMETGDFVVIQFHDDLRNKKPAGIHWLQTLTVGMVSSPEAREIYAYRLTSLFGAMLAAAAAMWGGSALVSRRAAFLGAGLLGASILLTTEAHIAKTDAVLCGLIVLAMAALARIRAGGGLWLAVLFWGCLGAGVMIKGPIAPMVAGLTLLTLAIWERRIAWMKPLLFWMGPSLFLILTVPWFLAVEISTGGAFLREAAGVDLGQKIVGAAEGHRGPIGMHLAALPILFWPGTLLLVPGLWLAFSRLRQIPRGLATDVTPDEAEREGAAWRFLLAWALPTWLVFELAPTKLVHYTLPAYPALALMAGAAFDRWMSGDRLNVSRWISLALFALAALAFAILVTPGVLTDLRAEGADGYPTWLRDRAIFEWGAMWRDHGAGLWPTLLILLPTGVAIYALLRRMPMVLIGSLVACALVTGFVYRVMVLPNQDWMLSSRAAVSALEEVCALPEGTAAARRASQCIDRAPQLVRAIAFGEPSFVFALAGRVTLPPKSTTDIPPVQEDNRPAWLINLNNPEGKEALKQLVEAAAASDRCIRFARRLAWNYSNNESSELVAAVLEPAGCLSEPLPEDLRPMQPATAPSSRPTE
jgi:4-amino-4-deoxy-L-arabinose transferase-like glycosyltransferase